MKFFKKSILAMMAIAATAAFTACDNDNGVEYEDGQQSPGAYFPNTNPESVELSEDATMLTVNVCRTSVDAPSTYTLSFEDASGIFSAPTEVVFPDGVTSTVVAINYDLEQVVTETSYELTLTVAQGTNYGSDTYTFEAILKDPVVTEKAGAGTGTYTYTLALDGDDPGLPVYYSYNPKNPDYRTYTVYNWAANVPLNIVMPDVNARDENGNIPVRVLLNKTGYIYDEGINIYIADLYYVYNDILGRDASDWEGLSYYNPETGLFTLYVMWFYVSDGSLRYYGMGEEYLQLDGFPSYDVSATYMGYLTDAVEDQYGIITVSSSADCEEVKAYMMLTDDANEVYNAILTGVEGVQEATPGETTELQFKLEGPGEYTFMAVSFANGQVMQYSYDSFELSGASDWESVGLADFTDGWLMPGWGVTAANYIYSVEVQKSKTTENMWRMIKPWGDSSPIGEYNDGGKARNINFYYDGTYFYVEAQKTGYCFDAEDGEMYIGTFEGMMVTYNPGVSIETIWAYVGAYYPEEQASVAFGEITVPIPLIGWDAGDNFGYNWNNPQETVIVMPDASAATKAKAKAAKVANPRYVGLSKAIKFEKKDQLKKLPKAFDYNNAPKPVRR